MALAAGVRLGPYEILSVLGAGGMGEVYRATDTKLKRQVAVKILPPALAADPDRLARFQREAEVLAALNHPHIAAIYGLEDADGVKALVMELVEGPTLEDRIAQGLIPIDEALPIAKQIAEALAAAHEQGIIHRDLKPANIKVRADGEVKVLDFGLAKAMEPAAASSSSASTSPTITTPAMTEAGMILGTAAYMSPEQAKGRPTDKRSDVWAFGCVLYEMLTGKRPFYGEDVSDTLATVLKSDPDWSALPSTLPASICSLLQGSLKKDRRDRIAEISTALFLLSQPPAVSTGASVSQPPRPQRPAWQRWVFLLLGVMIGAAAAAIGVWKLKPSLAAPVNRFVITLPLGQQLTGNNRQAVALSPDGTRIVYVADGRLYVRAMSDFEARVVIGTDGTANPVFSPNSQSVVFWSPVDRTLKRITLIGGVPVTICPVSPNPAGISWGNDGILFAQPGVGILRVSPNGGTPEVLVALPAAEGSVHGPQMLPDGQTLLFTIAPGAGAALGDRWDHARVVVQSLKTGSRKTIVEGGADARYVPTGHILYALGGTVLGVPFNMAKLEITGGPVPIIEGVQRVTAVTVGTAQYAFSNSGSLVYVPGPALTGRQDLFLFDRSGGAQALKLPPGSYSYPRVSPDGKRLALETSDGKETNVSIYELSGMSSVRRLTFGGNNRFPVWSGDGHRVAFQSDREGDRAVFWQSFDGGLARRLTKPDPGISHVPESWSPDGETLLFNVAKGPIGIPSAGAVTVTTELWTLSVRDLKAAPFGDVQSVGLPTDAVFSPNGRWIAYQTGRIDAGEGTTYVQPFPPTGTKYQIARGGRPLWSRDGKELFYVPNANQFMAVTIRTQPSFTFMNPMEVPRGFGIADPASPRSFDITPGGQTVGIGSTGQRQSASAPAQIHVVLNWFEELKARVPTK